MATEVLVKWKYKKRLERLVEQVAKLDKQYTSFGYFKEQGSHPENPHLTYPELMGIHELRNRSDPLRRPVFEVSMRKYGKKFAKDSVQIVKDYVDKSALAKKPSPKTVLENIAETGISYIKPTFGNPSLLKPNTETTSKRKGGNRPLIEFGYLKEALSYKTSLRKSIKKYKR